jgi:universal stress protein E
MQRFKNILPVTDGMGGSDAALIRAVFLAKRNHARLTLLSVLDRLPRDMQRLVTIMTPAALQDFAIEERMKDLKGLLDPIRREDVQVEAKALCGTPFLEIIRQVLREKHDLVMMTESPADGLKGMFIGGTAMRLMRKCPCPVWVVKSTQSGTFGRILAAVDPSSSDEERNALNVRIMDLATSLARLERSELHILHAWTRFSEKTLRAGPARLPEQEVERIIAEGRRSHQELLGNLLNRYPLDDQKHHIYLVEGEAAPVIRELAESKGIDLIVMGTVCRTGFRGFFIGNTAERVLSQVDCSVLTVKPDGFVSPVELVA